MRTGSGGAGHGARHWHSEYQFCAIEHGDGWIERQGSQRPTPTGSLFVVVPGETHANGSRAGCAWRNLLVAGDFLEGLAREATGSPARDLAWAAPLHDQADIVQRFLRLHRMLEDGTRLACESALVSWYADLALRMRGKTASPPSCHPAVARARDYLMDNTGLNIGLDELSGLVGLSNWRLIRLFSATYGMPPHAFHVQARIEQAKRRLRAGESVVATALATGFTDQSHFTRHFRRLVGLGPGRYAKAVRR